MTGGVACRSTTRSHRRYVPGTSERSSIATVRVFIPGRSVIGVPAMSFRRWIAIRPSGASITRLSSTSVVGASGSTTTSRAASRASCGRHSTTARSVRPLMRSWCGGAVAVALASGSAVGTACRYARMASEVGPSKARRPSTITIARGQKSDIPSRL